ncbi:MAG TPA: hypothetical protein DDW91_17745 [Shewanella frigidimarina]|nr:hypothetical protein [Shewanella frigidimarina]
MMETLFTIAMILSVFVALTMIYDVIFNGKYKHFSRSNQQILSFITVACVMLWIVYLLCWAFIEMGL